MCTPVTVRWDPSMGHIALLSIAPHNCTRDKCEVEPSRQIQLTFCFLF